MKQKLFRILADLRFSIFILLLISLCSIIGTIIEQDQSIEIYKLNYPLTNPILGFLSWDRILFFGFDHVYKTWWFLSLIFVLGSSLTLCSILQQFPSLKIARRCQFFRVTNSFNRLKLSTVLNSYSFNRTIARIKKHQYTIFHQKNMIYCYKGLIGRVAPIVVHFSMILILLGTIIGSLAGFKAQEIVPKTEHFHIQNILVNGFSAIVPKTSVRINDFWITYTKSKTISQFYSDISILNSHGNEENRKTISVNHPLVKYGTYYYQTDWSLIGLRIQNPTKSILEYPLINASEKSSKIWLTWIPVNIKQQIGFLSIIDNLEGYCSLYSIKGQFLGNFELNETNNLLQNFTLLEIISSTGLQIKVDFGIPLIYLGFSLLMLSSMISYITYSQIWIIQKNNELFVGGTTNRALFDFELEFFNFLK